MTNLIEVIRLECLPRRNCMLTVFETDGESGFLYFKDSQLIEVNTGKLWAKDALQTILQWRLVSHHLSELPRGIKRALWEPLDQIIEEVAGSEAATGIRDAVGTLPSETAPVEMPSAADPFGTLINSVASVPGFLALLREDNGVMRLIAGSLPENQTLSPDWFYQFTERSTALGESLGAGLVKEWFLETDACRAWRVRVAAHDFIVLSDCHVIADDFEEQFRNLAQDCL